MSVFPVVAGGGALVVAATTLVYRDATRIGVETGSQPSSAPRQPW
jgi:hypothetical protein